MVASEEDRREREGELQVMERGGERTAQHWAQRHGGLILKDSTENQEEEHGTSSFERPKTGDY